VRRPPGDLVGGSHEQDLTPTSVGQEAVVAAAARLWREGVEYAVDHQWPHVRRVVEVGEGSGDESIGVFGVELAEVRVL